MLLHGLGSTTTSRSLAVSVVALLFLRNVGGDAVPRRTAEKDKMLRVTYLVQSGIPFQQCQSNLFRADADENNKLVAAEYADFVTLESGGKIKTEFKDMASVFVLVYHTAACTTCVEVTGQTDCCVGSQSFIPLGLMLTDRTQRQVLLEFICSQVDKAIQDRFPIVPTLAPTRSPTSPSAKPSVMASAMPSGRKTNKPILAPTKPPMEQPLPPGCIRFGYNLENQAGLNAGDIDAANGNSIKIGLETATRTTAIAILNQTFSANSNNLQMARSYFRNDSTNTTTLLPGHANNNNNNRHRRLAPRRQGAARAFELAVLDTFGVEASIAILDHYEEEMNEWFSSGTNHRLVTRLLLGDDRQRQRRLVYYTDAKPPRIVTVIDNPFCPTGDRDGITLCALVFTEVCVTLEAGDDANIVQTVLIAGFREAIRTMEFAAAIPSELFPQ
jgi:hypothetical protein